MSRYAKKRAIPRKLLKGEFKKILKIVKTKTQKKFPDLLPNNEKIEVNEVKDHKWSMYCWYQGNFISRIKINIDVVHYWTNLLNVVCHEAYPGHHTEHLVKEKLLFHDKGFFESSILFIYSPEMVISEGIGILAEKFLFNETKRAEIMHDFIFPNPKKEDSTAVIMAQNEIREGFRRFKCNLAYHKYVNQWSDEKLIKY